MQESAGDSVKAPEDRLQQGPQCKIQDKMPQKSAGHAGNPEIAFTEGKVQIEKSQQRREDEQTVGKQSVFWPHWPEKLIDDAQKNPQKAAV